MLDALGGGVVRRTADGEGDEAHGRSEAEPYDDGRRKHQARDDRRRAQRDGHAGQDPLAGRRDREALRLDRVGRFRRFAG
jgi:hypothetical protein